MSVSRFRLYVAINMIAFYDAFAYHCFVHINKAFIDLLNAAQPTATHWGNILPATERTLWQFWPRQRREAQQWFRQYVGAWIDSGFQQNRSEMPEMRTYASWGGQDIFQSLEGLLNSFLVIEGPREKTIFGLQANNSKQTTLRGSLSFKFDPRGGIRADPVMFRGHLKPNELAAMGFLYFWNSGQLFTLMRCANCGIFSVPSKVRKSYVRGWHCDRCRNSASAKAATAETRKRIRDGWFTRAVDAYLKFDRRPHRLTSNRTLFIVEQVNSGLPILDRIKRNTVTRNLAKIQTAAEGRNKNAKG